MATTIRNSNLFCLNCGQKKIIPYPIAIDDMSNMMTLFDNEHKNCSSTWKQPEADLTTSVEQRMEFWLEHGERGMSSETMFQVISGKSIGKSRMTHPSDPDDFRRCYLLLKTIPEWKSELHKLKSNSPVWSKLVDNWDKLTVMLEEQIAGGKNEMYKEMEKLGC